MHRVGIVLGVALSLIAVSAFADVSLSTEGFELKIGDDAVVKSLIIKANGEECVSNRDALPFFSVTQDRPFNNEIKLKYPNKRTTYPANRVKVGKTEGDGELRLVVGFELAPYEAIVKVVTKPSYLLFELVDFKVLPNGYGSYLEMDFPPVAQFRVAQLPVRLRENFGEWANAVWDDKAAVAVMSVEPLVEIDHETRGGQPVLTADLLRGYQLRSGKAAVVAAPGREAFLDAVAQMEVDWNLPRGVASRRSERINESYYWTHQLTPESVDEEIAWAKKGGFRMMLVYYPSYLKGGITYAHLGDYDWNEHYPNGAADLKKVLDRIKAAGITPGMHVLQTHVGLKSRYVTPVADARLNKTRRFSLAKAVSAEGEPDELLVNENPVDCVLREKCRILQFGGELFSYEGYVTKPPYRFTGVKRGACDTHALAHPLGEVGGILDVSEFSATSCYVDQSTTLQDEIAEKLAKIYDCGFEFVYFDGSEGVNPPCGVNVSLAQYRTAKKFGKMPLFTEGAAKSHFGWHLQSGANAFDVFKPEVFKESIANHPLLEAPIMQQNFTRLDFGWWGLYLPNSKLDDGTVTVGTQADMWEYGTSKAAAWDCPVALQTVCEDLAAHPRIDDLFETIRRWEDVRAKKWLSDAQRVALRDPKREFHLYLNERGEYELHEIEILPAPARAKNIRAFLFERNGRRVLAYWHVSGKGRLAGAFGPKGGRTTLRVAGRAYLETDLSAVAVKAAFADAVCEEFPKERWCGFNLLGMFCQDKMKAGDPRIRGRFEETSFRWIRDWGFNFVRLPIDYRFLTGPDDWMKAVEPQLAKLDEAVRLGERYGIHVQINLHRAPGYCCNPPQEKLSLFRHAEPLAAFTNLWAVLARRYRGISNDRLTFDLLNEPAPVEFYGCTPSNYAAVARLAMAAIRKEDPGRFIMSDGWRWGNEPVAELRPFDDNSGEAIHCYAPHGMTHFGLKGHYSTKTCPSWPPEGCALSGMEWLEKNCFKPWHKASSDGTFFFMGEFGCHQPGVPHATYLAWLEDVLAVCQRHGWGWALWNLDGKFGILDTGRTDVELEEFEGHKLDRKALELLQKWK